MDRKGNLLARARPIAKAKKKPVGFLGFPGELRNRIYDYYFQQGFKCEFAGKKAQLGRTQRKTMKFCTPGSLGLHVSAKDTNEDVHTKSDPVPTVRFSGSLGRYKRVRGLDTKWSTSLTGLVFVCKQVYAETICFLYQNTTFAFDSPRRVANFLKVPSVRHLASVTRIQLKYHAYGDPTAATDVKWKKKHLDSWSRGCKAAAKQLANLQQLDIWVYANDVGIRLDLYLPCLRPIFYFRKRRDPSKTLAKALVQAVVHVDTPWSQPNAFVDKRLSDASSHLHRLFGEAVGRFVLGATIEDAMTDFNDAWENRYSQWHHHLRFAETGW